MNTSRLRLRYLFDRYYSKTATLQERDELFAIIEAGESDHVLSALIQKAWDEMETGQPFFDPNKTNVILNNVLVSGQSLKIPKNYNRKLNWIKVSAAAVVMLFMGIVAYQYVAKRKKTVTHIAVNPQRPHNDALPGSNKAVLTLANGKTITLDDAQNGTLAQQGSTIVKKAANGQLVYNVAALAKTNTAPSINTIATPRGGQYQVILPDGTKVWLNSASSLRFPTRFTGNLRQVEITGEAYFEVTKNAAMPFKVKTNRAEIEVLGTHFNVMAYDDENVMKTTLLEGAVNINSGSFSAKLKPGQQAQIRSSGKNKVVDDIDMEDEIAWKNGIFQFRDAGIDDILRQASRWYDLDIVYKGNTPVREFNGHISRNVKASELLNMLKYAGIELKIEGNKIIVL